MTFEVTTPILNEAVDMARAAYKGVTEGSLDTKDATVVNTSASRLIQAVSTEVRARLAAPKIRSYEERAQNTTARGRRGSPG